MQIQAWLITTLSALALVQAQFPLSFGGGNNLATALLLGLGKFISEVHRFC